MRTRAGQNVSDPVPRYAMQIDNCNGCTPRAKALILFGSLFLLGVTPARARARWKLVWSDEFNGAANSQPDPSKWAYDLGANNGWGNKELETYSNLPENAHLDGKGHLIIRAESTTAGYTSARVKTQGLFTMEYGRIEARIKLPSGRGIWPAFWMLGNDIDAVGWPRCGEIDIAENNGREPSVNHGSLHGPGYSGSGALTAEYRLPNGKVLSNGFHTFGIQWSPQAISFYVDGIFYKMTTPASMPLAGEWVFNHPFFLLLNVAVGGNYPGDPDETTKFPQAMIVDYVRVYQGAAR